MARARTERFIFPDAPRSSIVRDEEVPDGVGFKGGKVLDAVAALYGRDRPVAVFDFGSLYPSIMRERNLCVTSRMTLRQVRGRAAPYDPLLVAGSDICNILI